MPRYREPFTLYPRKTKSGKVWYYRCYNEYGERTAGRSTGETSKTRARLYCAKLDRDGLLLPSADPFFRVYAADWWVWDLCPYVKKKAQNRKISKRHATDERRTLEEHLLPYFGKYHLSNITPTLIEKFIYSELIEKKGLSAKRAINIAGTLRTMVNEARRHGMLRADVFAEVEFPRVETSRRELLTLEEVRTLFAPENVEKAWNGHHLYRAVNILAASTGLRMGEILAIQDEDLRDGWIHVAYSWHWKYGRGPTKNREERDVPVPKIVIDALRPFQGHKGYVFSINRGDRPASGSRITEALYKALKAIGITEEERRARGLTFHAWRAWFNTILQTRKIPGALVRQVIGHKTEAMTDRYTSISLEQLAPVVAAQEELFSDGEK